MDVDWVRCQSTRFVKSTLSLNRSAADAEGIRMNLLIKNRSKQRGACSIGFAGDNGDKASRRLVAAGRLVAPVQQRRTGSRSTSHLLLTQSEQGISIFTAPDGLHLLRKYLAYASYVFHVSALSDNNVTTHSFCSLSGWRWRKLCQ